MRASRQTELQREFPLHVVCSWLGNSPRIAQQSYLLVTEDDFAKAAVAKKVEPPSSPHKTQYHSTNHEVVYVVNECSLKRTVSMISPKSSCAPEHSPIRIAINHARRLDGDAQKRKRVKEQKEKGLLLHPPLSHKST
jgi:hypothetical protein